ncbi:LysR family substrate-binding domain-containing protein [Streptomyces violaceus]
MTEQAETRSISLGVEVGLCVDLSGFADEPWVWLRREASPDYHDQLMATCRRAGFTPEARHVANSILTQLAMVACGLGVTLVSNVAVRSIQGPIAYRPLSDPADIVELSLVSRDGGHEPLVEEFLRHAAGSRDAQVGGEFVPPVEGDPPLEDRLRGDGQREPEEGP